MPAELPLCACGCGGMVSKESNKYVYHHHIIGKPKSEEFKERLRKSKTEEHIRNCSKAAQKRAQTPEGYQHLCEAREKARTPEVRKKMSESAQKKRLSEEHKKKIGEAGKGRIISEKTLEKLRNHRHSIETRKKISKAQKGANGSNWQGGVSDENSRIRRSLELREWRKSVFERDNFTCQKCGAKHTKGFRPTLHPHHVKSFANYPDLRFDVNNGVTLCKNCHSNAHGRVIG